jgi:hypothetical protein
MNHNDPENAPSSPLITIGPRVRKSPYFDATLRPGFGKAKANANPKVAASVAFQAIYGLSEGSLTRLAKPAILARIRQHVLYFYYPQPTR